MSVNDVLIDIANIIAPNEGPTVSLEDVFLQKLKKFKLTDRFNLLKSFSQTTPCESDIWWQFICLLLEKLLQLKLCLSKADEKEQLMSVNQKKHLASCIEMAVTLGIVSHLPKGIGIGLRQRSSSDLTLFSNITEQQKILCLDVASSVLMDLCSDETFLPMITSRHLGDLLASLFYLLLPPLWSQPIPEEQRNKFKGHLTELIEKTCQHVLIKELMLLNGNKDCPPRLSRAVRGIMTERLMLDGGVVATAKAILDVVGDVSPNQWKTVEIMSRLIIKPHIKDVKTYQNKVYPQVLSLLYSKENAQFVQIAVTCVRMLFEMERDICNEYFINYLISPFINPCNENQMSNCIDALHNCFGIPSSDHWAMSPSSFDIIHVPLFRLYCKIIESPLIVKVKVADIVWAIVSQCDFKETFDKFVFDSCDITFAFGNEGGVLSEIGKEECFWEEASEVLLNLILSKESDSVTVKFFHSLLDTMINGDIEKKLVGAKLLAEICAEPPVQEAISKDSSDIVKFIRSLIEREQDDDIICLSLMVLGVILSNRSLNRSRNWDHLKELADPLKTFITNSKNRELRVLANEIYSTIVTHGVIGQEKVKQTKPDKKSSTKCNYTSAMEEATDALIPVRAHGIKELGRLLLENDEESITKKEMILCVFKENLKEEDSYVYLAAIEGLAAIATTFPDDVIVTLCEEYSICKVPETRMKVGESLVRVIQMMNEMAGVYKNELVNTFLNGCRDNDHLVRASSLSNIGELCKILSFRIHAYLTEIFYCVECIIETDKFVEPRRAAVMVLTSLLKGLGPDALSVLEQVLLQIYRKLKLLYQVEKDDITKLHAQLALEEINACSISFFCKPQKLEKRIFVLDPP